MSVETIKQIAFCGIMVTGLLLLIALFTKLTGGLFVARTPQQYLKDQNDPKYQTEKTQGNKFKNFVFKFIPPFFIGFILIMIIAIFFY